MEVTDKRLKELERAEKKLNALESGGVDNWDNYDDSLEPYRQELELEEKRDYLLEELAQVFGECAYEPSERGAGIAFHNDAYNKASQIIIDMGVTFTTG